MKMTEKRNLSHSNRHAYVKERLQEGQNRFITHESFGGILLGVSVFAAMIIANSSYSEAYFSLFQTEFGGFWGDKILKISFKDFINDVLMSFFFLLVGLEMKREMLYGELAGFKKVSFSVFAAIGGIICPVLIYLYFNMGTPHEHGFGVAMSTDTAFALGVILILGDRVPKILKIFLTTLAVADDLGAIVVIAVFYSENIQMEWIYAALFFVSILIYLNYRDNKYLSLYFLVGVLLWVCVHHSGIHVTIAAVILAMAIPGRTRVAKKYFLGMIKEFDKIKVATNNYSDVLHTFEEEKATFFQSCIRNIKNFMTSSENIEKKIDIAKTSELVHMLDAIGVHSHYAKNPLIHLTIVLQPLCSYFFVPLFAFANAGVHISENLDLSLNGVMLGTVLGLVIGKPIGILLFSFIGEKLKLSTRPKGLNYSHVFSVGVISGIGFTMSMFVANLAYENDIMSIDLSKIAILIASSIATVLGVLAMYFSTMKTTNEAVSVSEDEEIQKLKESATDAI